MQANIQQSDNTLKPTENFSLLRKPSVIDHNGKKTVSARSLYECLGLATQHYSKWSNKNIVKNSFAIENEDWCKLPLSGRSNDYALSLDFAKRLAMMARTTTGELIRNYFIECERQAIQDRKPLSQIEILLQAVQLLNQQDSKIQGIEGRINELEAKSTTDLGYYSIVGFATLKRISVDIKTAATLGAKAKAACRKIGAIINTIPDPRFGRVNVYPHEILESVFNDYFRAS